ncbi:WD40 repeat-containing protein [Nitzschia inconspicua]|uniref:Probable cytosolic iron-sulfur protein assembly protein CIAO1 homolog n=1 Tax=Nitzschia inconspicua TaxID=303405 RepID=A0A9K3KJR7_9STRA|nr:WD40 repeat-containing protein [Nitzschia inconspicua]
MEDEQQQNTIESPLSQEDKPNNKSQQLSIDPEPSPPFLSTASLVETHVFYPPTRSIGSGANTLRYTCHSPAWHCAFSTSGEWLAACFGAPNPCIRLWRYQEGAELPPVPATTKSDKQYHHHQHHSKHKDNEHRRRPPPPHCCDPDDFHSDISSSWILHSTLEGIHQRTIRCVAFCPLAKTCILAAASFDATVTLWQYDPQKDEWECTTQLEGHENEVKYVSWNATGSLLATCGRDKTLWIWETFLDGTIGGSSDNEFDCIAVLNGHEGDVKCVKFAPSHNIWGDGDEILLSASYDNTIKIWAEDAGDWYCAASIPDVHQDTIWSLALSPGGGRLVTASSDGSLGILKSYTPKERTEKFPDLPESTNGLWKCVGTLDNAHSSTVYGLDYAPARAGHGRIASSGGDNRIQIYREVRASTSDKPLFDLDVAVDTNHGDVNCVCWHPRDGSILCSAGDDGTVRLWRFDP